MPAIGDQVASLEHDHADALAQIDMLNAKNAALLSANSALSSENAALNKYADEIKAMVESVATGALHMLQAARAPITAAVEKVVTEVETEVKSAASNALDFVVAVKKAALANVDGKLTAVQLDAVNAKQPPSIEQQAVIADILHADSGDEQPLVPAASSRADQVEHISNLAGTTTDGALLAPDLSGGIDRTAQPFWKNTAAEVESKIAEIPEAVERILHHSSASSAPPVTSIRAPVDMTMIVEHDGEGLPMFLRRGTAFEAMTRGVYA